MLGGDCGSCDGEPGSGLELLKNIREDFTITEKATIRAFSWLKVPTFLLSVFSLNSHKVSQQILKCEM